jgi:hypothetical protein
MILWSTISTIASYLHPFEPYAPTSRWISPAHLRLTLGSGAAAGVEPYLRSIGAFLWLIEERPDVT